MTIESRPPVSEFLALREAVVATRIGSGGRETCLALSDALDREVRRLTPDDLSEDSAVVAVGGYGRREQCVHSDVDIMILYSDGEPKRLIDSLLYPLWDAGLKVGHSVRTLDDCVSGAREHFETLTALLSSRLIAGDGSLFQALHKRLHGVLRGKPLASQLAGAERDRRNLDPYPLLEADLKEGRGGLRTFQGFQWERDRATLLGQPLPHTPSRSEVHAMETLLSVRNALHAVMGRPHDQMSFDLRGAAATWLGTKPEDMMRDVCSALRTGDRLATERWPDIAAEPGRSRRRFRGLRSRFRPDETPRRETVLTEVCRIVTGTGPVWFDSVFTEEIERSPGCAWTAADRDAFSSILASGVRGWQAFDRLDQLGWIATSLPEWRHLVALPQQDPFHDHPADAHSWRTVDEMLKVVSSGGKDAWLADIAADFGSTEELVLCAFFHDIGKGTAGQLDGADHCERGAVLMERLCERIGYGPATSSLLVSAVRHHLLLAETATRRNVDDAHVSIEIADAVGGDLRVLQMLLLLTVADSKATGDRMWTHWKASLIERLYRRTAARLERRDVPESLVDAVVAAGTGAVSAREIEEHLAAMPGRYAETTPGELVLAHWKAATHGGSMHVHTEAGSETTRLIITGPDRPGLLSDITGVLAIHNVSVLHARLATRADSLAIDTFFVVDSLSGGTIEPDRWPRIERDIEAAAAGNLDVRAGLETKARSYPARATPVPVSVVRVPDDRSAIVEVRCGDRIGRLHEIASIITAEGMQVGLATIDTRGPEVIDTFHLVDEDHHPIRDDDRLVRCMERIRSGLDDARH